MQQAFWGMHGSKSQQHDFSFINWIESVEGLWNKQTHNVPDSIDALYHKLISSSRFYINLSEPFVSSTQSGKDPANILVSHLESYLEAIEKNKAETKKNSEKFSEDMLGFWKLPFDMWQHQLKFLGEIPDSFTQFMKTSTEGNFENEVFSKACEQYFKALQVYQSAYVEMSLTAASELMQKLQDDAVETAQLASTLWIEIFEKHYTDLVCDSGYSKHYADVINSWMELIQQTEKLITPWLKSMNMPTREDMLNCQGKQAAMRRKAGRKP